VSKENDFPKRFWSVELLLFGKLWLARHHLLLWHTVFSFCSADLEYFLGWLWVDLRLPSGPNKASRLSVRMSTKSFSDSNKIWYVGRGQWVMHNGMPYGLIQGQVHVALKVRNSSIFKTRLCLFQWELASDCWFLY